MFNKLSSSFFGLPFLLTLSDSVLHLVLLHSFQQTSVIKRCSNAPIHNSIHSLTFLELALLNRSTSSVLSVATNTHESSCLPAPPFKCHWKFFYFPQIQSLGPHPLTHSCLPSFQHIFRQCNSNTSFLSVPSVSSRPSILISLDSYIWVGLHFIARLPHASLSYLAIILAKNVQKVSSSFGSIPSFLFSTFIFIFFFHHVPH